MSKSILHYFRVVVLSLESCLTSKPFELFFNDFLYLSMDREKSEVPVSPWLIGTGLDRVCQHLMKLPRK